MVRTRGAVDAPLCHLIRFPRRLKVDEEMPVICEIVERYPYVAMVQRYLWYTPPGACAQRRIPVSQDTEFPGTVARPVGNFRPRSSEEKYQSIRCNVDLLNIIQLGITFCDEEGNLAPGCSTWQFNFRFNLSTDLYAQDSIDLLTQAGIDFKKHEEYGIDPHYFAQVLMVSGVVLSDDVRWVSFHSGYDFGYLLKILTCKPLPETEHDFHAMLRLYFPFIYDIKFIANSSMAENLKGGLNKIAEQLKVRWVEGTATFLALMERVGRPRAGPPHRTRASGGKRQPPHASDILQVEERLL